MTTAVTGSACRFIGCQSTSREGSERVSVSQNLPPFVPRRKTCFCCSVILAATSSTMSGSSGEATPARRQRRPSRSEMGRDFCLVLIGFILVLGAVTTSDFHSGVTRATALKLSADEEKVFRGNEEDKGPERSAHFFGGQGPPHQDSNGGGTVRPPVGYRPVNQEYPSPSYPYLNLPADAIRADQTIYVPSCNVPPIPKLPDKEKVPQSGDEDFEPILPPQQWFINAVVAGKRQYALAKSQAGLFGRFRESKLFCSPKQLAAQMMQKFDMWSGEYIGEGLHEGTKAREGFKLLMEAVAFFGLRGWIRRKWMCGKWRVKRAPKPKCDNSENDSIWKWLKDIDMCDGAKAYVCSYLQQDKKSLLQRE